MHIYDLARLAVAMLFPIALAACGNTAGAANDTAKATERSAPTPHQQAKHESVGDEVAAEEQLDGSDSEADDAEASENASTPDSEADNPDSGDDSDAHSESGEPAEDPRPSDE